jgi:hypothetical protein
MLTVFYRRDPVQFSDQLPGLTRIRRAARRPSQAARDRIDFSGD